MKLIPHDSALGWTPFAWLIYILPFTLTPMFRSNPTAEDWLIFILATLAFLPLYFRGYWPIRDHERILVAAAMTAMAVGFWPISHGAGAMFIYGGGVMGMLQPPRKAMIGVGVITLIALAEAPLLRRDILSSSWPVIFTVIIGGINIHFTQVGRTNARLRLAQTEIEHLAKMAERERIARDLHDLLGHTLSVIVLKAELATKLADRDIDRARTEIADVERISRDALAQVRAAVRGYRSRGLQKDIDDARATLFSAGVTLDAHLDPITLPPAHEAVIALAIREAITNVVRHARAKNCAILLRTDGITVTVTIADDGSGGSASFGNGLAGMRERVETLAGTLEYDGKRGTTLTISLPLPAQEHSA